MDLCRGVMKLCKNESHKSWNVGRLASKVDSLQRYPFCAVGDRELSMQSGADSYAAKREIRSCHIGNGRSCYHHERKSFPANKSYTMVSLLELPGRPTSEFKEQPEHKPAGRWNTRTFPG